MEENTVIDILAAREAELGLPVYAQFVVTQSLKLPETSAPRSLVIPVYWPSREHSLIIDLLKEGNSLWRWRVIEHDAGILELNLSLPVLKEASGNLEVRFVSDATHETAEQAPRLFIESADEQYPDGNYRIADNAKAGDVSLRIVEQRTVGDRFFNNWQRRPLRQTAELGRWLLIGLLLLISPSVLGRIFWPRRAEQEID